MIHKVGHVLTDATKIGWGHVVIVCNDYFALLLHNTTHKDNYHLERNIPFGFIQLTCYIIFPYVGSKPAELVKVFVLI